MSDDTEDLSPTPEQLQAYADAFNASATLGFFGAKIEFADGKARAIIDPVTDAMRGGLGGKYMNGGVVAALFDLTIGITPALVDPSRRCATMSLSMNFERPVAGERVVCEAWIDRAGPVVFASAHLLDGQGNVCAHAQGLVRHSKQKWESGVSPTVN
jgi:acyl-coenzyme A thioesterase PaaI-like protein